jgi:hypothetical protein
MKPSAKIRDLEAKILDLQAQHQHLLNQRQQEIAALITQVDLTQTDDKILIGGLLFLKEKITINDSMLEAWHNAGERFLRRTKSSIKKSDKSVLTRPLKSPNPTH